VEIRVKVISDAQLGDSWVLDWFVPARRKVGSVASSRVGSLASLIRPPARQTIDLPQRILRKLLVLGRVALVRDVPISGESYLAERSGPKLQR
jgi:hypothetical protein